MNYFELYQLPLQLQIDAVLLKRKYYQLSKQYHPDFFDSSLGISEAENLQMSSVVNKAYAVLQDPKAILGYVLELQGIIAKDEKYQLPPDFLMEVMELNESMDDSTKAAIVALEQEITNPVHHLLQAADCNAFTTADWAFLKTYFYQQKYLDRLAQRNQGVEWFD